MSSILRKKSYILCIFFILRIHLMQLTKLFFSFIIEIYDIRHKHRIKHNYIFSYLYGIQLKGGFIYEQRNFKPTIERSSTSKKGM